MSSFKVQCPSCEAQVLIKNPSLVGSKVECPKCKYRFKVEAPADEPAKDAGKPDTKDAKDAKADKKDAKAGKDKEKKDKEKKPKGGKAKNKKLVGIGLAVGAVALLGIGGYVMFGGDDTPKSSSNSSSGPRPSAINSTPGGDGSTSEDPDKDKKDGDPKKDKTPPVPSAPRSNKQPTNLLPGKSVAVYRFDLGRLRQTPPGVMLFDPVTAEMVKTSLGFEVTDIDQYYHCSVGEKVRAPVGLIRLRVPTDEKKLAAKVVGAGTPKTVGGKALMPVTGNPLLAAAGNALAARTLLADVYTSPPPPPAKAPAYGVCVYDTQHLLVGEFSALEEHLAGLNKDGYPEFQTVVHKEEPPPEAPKGAGDMPMPMPTPAPTPPPAPPPPAPTGNKAFTTNPTYLSLDPRLRLVLLTMLEDKTGEPAFVLAERFDDAAYPRAGVKKEYAPIAKALDPVLSRTEHVGMNLVAFSPRQLVANVRFFAKSDSDARMIALEKLTPTFTESLPLLSLLLQTYIELRNYADPNYVPPGGLPMNMGEGQPPSGYPPGVRPPGIGGPPPGMSGPPPGMITPGVGGPPIIPSGPPPGMSGPPGLSGPGGMVPGTPVDPNRPTLPPSFVALRLIDQAVLVTVELNWPDETYSRLLSPRLLGYVNQLKGKAAVYSGSETHHALARAVKQYAAERKEFPPGTVPVTRSNDHETRLGVSYPPAQRASFFVEFLPALGRGGLRQMIDPSQGWLFDRNAAQAGSWVPELLVSYYPQTAWRATSPLAPDFTFGGTNFVAVAGIGHDAPRYDPKKPADATRAGITGYDWGSKLEAITDGPGNTIYLLQTPPGSPRPWAAGGGATVVGLDPENPMAAFKHRRPDGKEGTYAIMADGTVRWLPADIDAKVMLGMATRAGGEKLPNLDDVAPRVLPPGTKAELTAGPVSPPQAVPQATPPQPAGAVQVAPPPTLRDAADATPKKE